MDVKEFTSTEIRSNRLRRAENLEAFLRSRIIGQDDVVANLSNNIKYGWCNLSTPGRPRGTLFLLGPTGVGKTESIRAGVEYMYGDAERNFLRLDMSEFSRQAGEEALMNLIGTPGGKSAGRMGAFLEQCGEGVILYDEIEKSHPAIFTILLQLSRINVGDIVAIVAHRGLKGEHRVCRIAKIDSSGKVLPIFGEARIEVSSGINLNNGKQYVSAAYCVGGLIYKEDYRESEGRESQLHEKYDLNPANPVIRRRLCMEISMTDLNHRQLNAPPKATCSMPKLKFYKILEKYDPPKQDAHTMYIELLELRDKGGNTEQYLNERETYFKKRMIK